MKMEVYKAVRDNIAVFLNPDKFDEFLSQGYVIYRVHDLENESLDELISQKEIKELESTDNSESYIVKEGDKIDNNEPKS